MLNTQAYTRLSAALPKLTAEDVIDMGPVLVKIIPELKPTLGFDQHSPHHKYDLFTHIAHVVGNVPPDLTVRWAALLHDVGKIPTLPGMRQAGAISKIMRQWARTWRIPFCTAWARRKPCGKRS